MVVDNSVRPIGTTFCDLNRGDAFFLVRGCGNELMMVMEEIDISEAEGVNAVELATGDGRYIMASEPVVRANVRIVGV